MSQTSINIRMDESLKKQFDSFCSELGMSMTTAFCLFAKTAVRQQRIPFELSTRDENNFTMSEVAELKRRVDDLDSGKGVLHELMSDK